MATLFDDILQRGVCRARVRLFGFLWRVKCGGTLATRQSAIHAQRSYSVCEKCGDVTWPARMPDAVKVPPPPPNVVRFK